MCAWILEIMSNYFCMYMCACIKYNTEHSLWESGCKMSCIGTSILSTKLFVYIGPPTT